MTNDPLILKQLLADSQRIAETALEELAAMREERRSIFGELRTVPFDEAAQHPLVGLGAMRERAAAEVSDRLALANSAVDLAEQMIDAVIRASGVASPAHDGGIVTGGGAVSVRAGEGLMQAGRQVGDNAAMGAEADAARASGRTAHVVIPGSAVGSRVDAHMADRVGARASDAHEARELLEVHRRDARTTDAGAAAAIDGEPHTANPWPTDTAGHEAWSQGWRAQQWLEGRDQLPCGHPVACVRSSNEYHASSWCGWCEDVAAIRADVAQQLRSIADGAEGRDLVQLLEQAARDVEVVR